jgi:hypothetical protein|mmetsp:Transcript_12037/g.21875  ORF Transcript_12037/g.21875 Transcript_12037/m.21875 type:complete len:159 (-) Transcript_12037:2139-2615(-)|eukprot:CAMPEP_0198303234 /NCGR_PEP_ID=MMETSP1449-20131203/56781_1 /TAXON_ID=420275 /ORGANISM="Attheya septentrionalis, Strain CCMP2084" /LENGTH=158 /DNA_ID=CAMNT_0044005721 /DNA_START=106 /DNA_END=582 /DNA_ORIENTATION=-
MSPVAFGTVEIREYPVVLGDNPECHYGPSVNLGWEYTLSKGAEPLNEYEKARSPRRKIRQLYMSQVRREALLEPAYSKDEVKQAIRLKQKVRQQRKFSNTSISPLKNIGAGLRHWSTNKKVKRAVRNLNKQNATTNESSVAKKNIYSGWWLPLSEYIF